MCWMFTDTYPAAAAAAAAAGGVCVSPCNAPQRNGKTLCLSQSLPPSSTTPAPKISPPPHPPPPPPPPPTTTTTTTTAAAAAAAVLLSPLPPSPCAQGSPAAPAGAGWPGPLQHPPWSCIHR